MSSKVSFTIRRPDALPRHLDESRSSTSSPAPKRTYSDREPEREDDDSDAESAVDDELVTGFDRFGVQRVHEKPLPKGPLTIPAQADRDWRALARQRRGHVPAYVPPSAAAQTGADGSVGGLGTRDAINSGPQFSGIQMRKKVKLEDPDDPNDPLNSNADTTADVDRMDDAADTPALKTKKEEEDEDDARALRALLDGGTSGPSNALAAIPVRMTEAEAYKQDVETFPEPATLDDYARVPIEQFGAALLRGMGWDPNATASKPAQGKPGISGRMEGREGKGTRQHKHNNVDPYIPDARPALLGIGAKEAEVLDDGSDPKKRKGGGRPEKRYVPLVKVGAGEAGGELVPARRNDGWSASGSGSKDKDKERRGDRDRGGGGCDGRRDRDDGDGRRERERHRDERSGPRDDRESGRDRDVRRDRDREGSRDHRDRDHDRRRDDRPRERDRERGGDRDREREAGGSSSRRR